MMNQDSMKGASLLLHEIKPLHIVCLHNCLDLWQQEDVPNFYCRSAVLIGKIFDHPFLLDCLADKQTINNNI